MGQCEEWVPAPPHVLHGPESRTDLLLRLAVGRQPLTPEPLLHHAGGAALELLAPRSIGNGAEAPAAPVAGPIVTEIQRREGERANLIAALRHCGGQIYGAAGAAKLLGVKPSTLSSRIKALKRSR